MARLQDNRSRVGKRGEDIAAKFLCGRGHTVLARNWRSGHLEVDIISEAADGIHFVEVKSRVFPTEVEPEENVGFLKRRRMVAAAGKWLKLNGREDAECIFDVVSVVFDEGTYRLDYFGNAFIPVFV